MGETTSPQYVHMGRVVFEDDDYVTLEIAKDHMLARPIEGGDRLLHIVFLLPTGPGQMNIFNPWEVSNGPEPG